MEARRGLLLANNNRLASTALLNHHPQTYSANMSGLDTSLDDLIKGSGKAPGGRRGASGPTRNARGAGNSRSTPYSRPKATGGTGANHKANADVRDVAASDNPVLKVKGDSKPNSVAGAICNIVRESAKKQPPAVVATGPAAINQSMKAIAIARKYLLEEDSPTDLTIIPKFEEDIRHGSRVCFELKKTRPVRSVPSRTTWRARSTPTRTSLRARWPAACATASRSRARPRARCPSSSPSRPSPSPTPTSPTTTLRSNTAWASSTSRTRRSDRRR